MRQFTLQFTIAAKNLQIGDKCLLASGKTAIIKKLEVEQFDTPETTYNFEVANAHTYYVGEQEILVHNACPTQYPPNNGAVPGTEKVVDLQTGQYGRYGNIGDTSKFITQAGASPSQLSLPPGTDPSIYTTIYVVKPIPGVVQSTVAPWASWGGIGGGIQYVLPKPIMELVKLGFIII